MIADFILSFFIIITMLLTTCATFIAAYEMQNVVAQAFRTNDQSASFTIENAPGWEKIKGNSSHNIIIFRPPVMNGTGIGIYAAISPSVT
jgi:ABC-type bacteriocin/lantibiotic exporter with double-glycine peptidase domain